MADDETGSCRICKKGHYFTRTEEIAFRQETDKGEVRCRVVIPMSVCDSCGAKHWDATAEEIVDEAIRSAYERLP